MPSKSAIAYVIVAPGRLSVAAQRRQIDLLAAANGFTIDRQYTSAQTADMLASRGTRPVIVGTRFLDPDLLDALAAGEFIFPHPAEFDEVAAMRADALVQLAEADAFDLLANLVEDHNEGRNRPKPSVR